MITAAYLHQKTYLLICSFDSQLTAYLRQSTQLVINIINNYVYMICVSVCGSGPAYLSEPLHVYTPSRTLPSSHTRMLKIQKYKRKTYGFRTLSSFGPHIWNSLPQVLRHCSTLSSFQAKLKTFLFSQYFRPNKYQYPVSATVSVCVCMCVRVCVCVCL